jgi:hypothetical protein
VQRRQRDFERGRQQCVNVRSCVIRALDEHARVRSHDDGRSGDIGRGGEHDDRGAEHLGRD